METVEHLSRKMNSVRDLQSVVKTMKGLAAVNIRQYEKAVKSLREYNRTVELGLRILAIRQPEIAASHQPGAVARSAVIVVGSDQGMCGQFNSRVAAHFRTEVTGAPDTQKPDVRLVLGGRMASELHLVGESPTDQLPLPSSVSEIGRRVQDILVRIDRWQEERGIRQVWILHQYPLKGARYKARKRQLIPIDENWLRAFRERSWPTNQVPSFTMEWEDLLSSLIRQYLFVSIYRAIAESLAAENAARLAAMQAAERNVEERLDELTARYHQRRQSQITEELLDVSAGFEVLKG